MGIILLKRGNHNKQEADILLKSHINNFSKEEIELYNSAKIRFYMINTTPYLCFLGIFYKNKYKIKFILYENIKKYSFFFLFFIFITNVISNWYYYHQLKYLIYIKNDYGIKKPIDEYSYIKNKYSPITFEVIKEIVNRKN